MTFSACVSCEEHTLLWVCIFHEKNPPQLFPMQTEHNMRVRGGGGKYILTRWRKHVRGFGSSYQNFSFLSKQLDIYFEVYFCKTLPPPSHGISHPTLSSQKKEVNKKKIILVRFLFRKFFRKEERIFDPAQKKKKKQKKKELQRSHTAQNKTKYHPPPFPTHFPALFTPTVFVPVQFPIEVESSPQPFMAACYAVCRCLYLTHSHLNRCG